MAKKHFVPDEKMQEVKATGQETLRFHAVTEAGFVLDGGAAPTALGNGGRLRFRTDSARVMLRFSLDANSMRPHPTQTYQGSCGFDLYVGAPGREKYYYVTRTTAIEGDFQLVNAHDAPDETFREFTLHLPLFAKVTRLEIGLERTATVKPPTRLKASPVALLGGEAALGRSASRPGMALANQLARILKRPVIAAQSPQELAGMAVECVVMLSDPNQKPFPKNCHNLLNTSKLYKFTWSQAKKLLGTAAERGLTDATHLNDLGIQCLAQAISTQLTNS